MLTEKQRATLELIEERIVNTGISPTYREIRDALGILSTGQVHRIVSQLEERGFVTRLPHHARALKVIKPQTHLNPAYQRGIKEGLRLAKKASKAELAMAS